MARRAGYFSPRAPSQWRCARGVREDSADARGGGAGIFAYGGCGEALSVVRGEGARAVANQFGYRRTHKYRSTPYRVVYTHKY